MSAKAVLSPKELALAIGVSESSLKRWADDGIVNVTRTAGGHRRIPISEAIRFIRDTHATVVRPEVLGIAEMASVSPDVDSTRETQRLTQMLEEGQCREARGLLMALYLAGASLAELCDGPIRAAMRHLGELWQHTPQGIMIEHRATDTCMYALNQLRALLNAPTDAPIAMGGAPSGDPYILPSLASAVVLLSSDFHVVNLGPNTPIAILSEAAVQNHARLVWLSVSVTDRPGPLAQEIAQLATHVGEHDIQVIVGGRASGDLPLPANPNLHTGTSMQQLVGLIERLNLKDAQPDTDTSKVELENHI